ncbi:HWE histidine kinase domain-containing protein [Pseudoponticoccus marisrubri]|uniref:histidine kinase n=1 Tax=Pseudoponticoccus marisrubri TaxID=1685382 RepID=A0A0W7WKT8_9RHOB|nr:HWE histidine kinase domain-containing protein [Pseudoponticoccus marisrubri]KUF11151.1 hypothetical protein AVJ23_08845 [Pseudoponticoccus marisrubri]
MRNDRIAAPDHLDLAIFMDSLPDEVAILDSDGVVVAANAAWRRFSQENGGDPSHYLGVNYIDVCRGAAGESSVEAGLIPDGLLGTLQTGEPFFCEYPCDSPSVKRWFEMSATRIMVNDHAYLTVQHRNITTRRVNQDAVEQAFIDNSAMSALVAGTSDAILTYDLNGCITTWNPAAEKLYGYPAEEIIGQSLEVLYPPDWPHGVAHYRDEIVAGRLERFEATRMARDGQMHEVWISCAPIRSSRGDVVAISNIHRDVTDLRKAEKARETIAREVIHRAKNMLSIVSAIQRQTARSAGSLDEFNRAFGARIKALSKSTDMLVDGAWTTVRLGDLLRDHLSPFIPEGDPRVEIAGPSVELVPQAVQTLGIAVHELATNSAKYGALAHPHGRITLRWQLVASDAGGRVLDLVWDEQGLATMPSTDQSGFGSTVLMSLAPSMLDTSSALEIGEDAVRWQIGVPESHFDPAP